MAVLTERMINDCVIILHVDGAAWTVLCAVLTADTGTGAHLLLFLLGGRGDAGHQLLALVGNHGDKVLGAGVGAIPAAHAFLRIHHCCAVHHTDSAIAADSGTAPLTAAAVGAKTEGFGIQLGRFTAILDTQLLIFGGCPFAAAAADKGNLLLKYGQIMEGIHNDFFLTAHSAGTAAHAFLVIDDCVIIDNGHSPLGTGSGALTAGDTPVAAGGAHSFLVLLGGGAGNEIGGVCRDHSDQSLGADTLRRTVSAAVTFFAVDHDPAVLNAHGTLLTYRNAGSDSHASTFAFPPLKA